MDGKIWKNRLSGTVLNRLCCLLLAVFAFFSPGNACALTEDMFSDAITVIRNYTYGTLLYDSAFLEPRYGPGISYATDYRFDFREGTRVRIMTIARDSSGNQWVMAEADTKDGPMRVYLLYYNARTKERTIAIDDPGKLATESEPLYNRDGCLLDDTPLRTGPGREYALMRKGIDSEYGAAIVASNKGWVLVEYIEDETRTETPLKYRGWVPFEAVIAY